MDDADRTHRDLSGNHPPAAALVVDAIIRAESGDPVEVAAGVLAALQQHYELRPR